MVVLLQMLCFTDQPMSAEFKLLCSLFIVQYILIHIFFNDTNLMDSSIRGHFFCKLTIDFNAY